MVTIVDSTMHVPRHAGSHMLAGQEGRLYGTVGGGMLEYRCTRIAAEMLTNSEAGLKQFRLSTKDTADLGMICGGDVDVLFTPWPGNEQYARICADLLKRLRGQAQGWLVLPLSGAAPFAAAQKPAEFSENQTRGKTAADGQPCFAEQLHTLARVYIFGGGHLAQELVPLLAHLGFRCVVADDRPEFSTRELFPDAEETFTVDYSRLPHSGIRLQPQDLICIMTRGHLGDTDCQRFALKSPASYIGVVGSIRKVESVRRKLLEEGYGQNDLDRVTSPIGIDIHSETPAEIAVSIAAQLIEHRAGAGT